MAIRTLNLIGAGRVGRTLALLWQGSGTFRVRSVLTRSAAGARSAATFIGAARAAAALQEMGAAEVWMLATPDSAIASSCAALGQSGLLRAGDIVFHASGALASSALHAAESAGAATASVHPLKSFADPADAARTFVGTYCVAEGSAAALRVLRPAFEEIGGRVSEIDPRHKALYHAASVIVCNCLTALLEAGLRGYAAAGLDRRSALAMIEPLVRETVDNAFRLGTVKALTGPVARGDADVVASHLESLRALEPAIGGAYRHLGAIAVELARAQGAADVAALDRVASLLEDAAGQGLPGKVTNGGLGSRSGGK